MVLGVTFNHKDISKKIDSHRRKAPKLCFQCLIPVGRRSSPSLPSYPKLSSPLRMNARSERKKESRSRADSLGSIDGESRDPGAMSPEKRSKS
jgi:hypothetical protein